jgi:hypothetical protein
VAFWVVTPCCNMVDTTVSEDRAASVFRLKMEAAWSVGRKTSNLA